MRKDLRLICENEVEETIKVKIEIYKEKEEIIMHPRIKRFYEKWGKEYITKIESYKDNRRYN